MDEKPDQIIGHIEAQRHELGRNLNELESRVRASTNWRTYYERNAGMAMGAALGGGLLLGVLISSKRHSGTHRQPQPGTHSQPQRSSVGLTSASHTPKVSSPVTSQQFRQVTETLDHVKAALIAFGIAKAKEFVAHAIPGIEPHLTDAEQRGRQHASGPPPSQSWQSSPHNWQSAGAHGQEPVPSAVG